MGATHLSPHENFPSPDDYYLLNLSKTNKYQVNADSIDSNPIGGMIKIIQNQLQFPPG